MTGVVDCLGKLRAVRSKDMEDQLKRRDLAVSGSQLSSKVFKRSRELDAEL